MLPTPEIVALDAFFVEGVSTETSNVDERVSITAKIPELWRSFRASITPNGRSSTMFAVYHEYESNEHGVYRVTVGVRTSPPMTEMGIRIASGRYAVFVAKGEFPGATVQAWNDVWNYFSTPQAVRRRFETDFEEYRDHETVAIYVGIEA